MSTSNNYPLNSNTFKVFILLFFLVPLTLPGQKLPKQSLIEDLIFLNEAVSKGHPVNYDPRHRLDILSVIDRAKAMSADSISAFDYTLWVEKGIYHIGCIHTSIRTNPLKLYHRPSFIPLTAAIQKRELIITSCLDKSRIGEVIRHINGHQASEIISYYEEYKASDGATRAFSTEYFHFASSSLISRFLRYPEQYQIGTSEGEFTLNGQNKAVYRRTSGYSETPVLSNQANHLYLKDDFVLLKVESFDRSDKGFFKLAFKKIHEMNTERLIVDVRQNTGGNRKAAIALTKFLVDRPFGYSILQPRLATGKYLNGKGKFFLFLSKLKYNVGNVYNMRHADLGTEFKYAYKPSSKNHFSGELYVLTDGFTASAATMVTSWLKQHSEAVFIGSQASGGYNGNNGGSFPLITLPNSRIQIRFPAYRLILDQQSDQRTGIIPGVLLDTKTDISTIMERIKQQ